MSNINKTVEVFKKGQIVPRRLRLAVTDDRKAQHRILFGCDVEVEGRKVTALSDGSAFYVRRVTRRMNNGTFKKCALAIRNVFFFGSKYGIQISGGAK